MTFIKSLRYLYFLPPQTQIIHLSNPPVSSLLALANPVARAQHCAHVHLAVAFLSQKAEGSGIFAVC